MAKEVTSGYGGEIQHTKITLFKIFTNHWYITSNNLTDEEANVKKPSELDN